MPTLLERHDTSQNGNFQRRVKMAALAIAGEEISRPAPVPPAGNPPDPAELAAYDAAAARRGFANRVVGDPDMHAPRIALALLAMVPDGVVGVITGESSEADTALVGAMTNLFQVYVG